MILSEILVPLLNANEPEARLVSIHVKDGQLVSRGMLLFTIETTKAASEIESPGSGHIRMLAREGEILRVGDRMAVITESVDEPWKAFHPARPPERRAPLRMDIRRVCGSPNRRWPWQNPLGWT